MFKSLQVCGTSGSGKTTLVRRLYEESHCEPVLWLDTKTKVPTKCETKKPLVSTGEHPEFGLVFVLGSYEATCGGCDTIPSVKTVAHVLDTLNTDYGNGICVFEGLMISHMIGTVGDMQKQLGTDYHWRAYLDTELQTCLDNVVARRRAAGNFKPFNPANTQADWPRVRQSANNWVNQGGHAETVRYDSAWTDFTGILRSLKNV